MVVPPVRWLVAVVLGVVIEGVLLHAISGLPCTFHGSFRQPIAVVHLPGFWLASLLPDWVPGIALVFALYALLWTRCALFVLPRRDFA
ncbi:MAG: hypothetical protein HY791_22495 [Deltaproteobacteria bacterium]|nr:hypothetical protein [Deltaproteobacteria bacterium]